MPTPLTWAHELETDHIEDPVHMLGVDGPQGIAGALATLVQRSTVATDR